MFNSASAFNHDISSWTGTAATTAQSNMFSGATAFQAKYTCTDAVTGPASSCNTIKSDWVAPSPPPPSSPSPPPSPPFPPSGPPPPCLRDVVGIVPGAQFYKIPNTCTILAVKGLCHYAGDYCPESCGGNYCTDGSSTFDPNQACPVGAQCALLPGRIFDVNGNPTVLWTVVDKANAEFMVEAGGSGVTTYGAVSLGTRCLYGGVENAYDCYQPAEATHLSENAPCIYGSFCVHKQGGALGRCCPDRGGTCVWTADDCALGYTRPLSYMISATNIRNSMCTIKGHSGYISCGPSQTCRGPDDRFECSV